MEASKTKNLRISDFISEALVGFGVFFIFYSPFISFGDKNIENFGLFRFVFPAFSILVTAILYQKTFIIHFNAYEKRIFIKKPFSRRTLESILVNDLKDPKISRHFEKRQLNFESSITKKKYRTIIRNKTISIVKSWV